MSENTFAVSKLKRQLAFCVKSWRSGNTDRFQQDTAIIKWSGKYVCFHQHLRGIYVPIKAIARFSSYIQWKKPWFSPWAFNSAAHYNHNPCRPSTPLSCGSDITVPQVCQFPGAFTQLLKAWHLWQRNSACFVKSELLVFWQSWESCWRPSCTGEHLIVLLVKYDAGIIACTLQCTPHKLQLYLHRGLMRYIHIQGSWNVSVLWQSFFPALWRGKKE